MYIILSIYNTSKVFVKIALMHEVSLLGCSSKKATGHREFSPGLHTLDSCASAWNIFAALQSLMQNIPWVI